jgi:hypothetical protein
MNHFHTFALVVGLAAGLISGQAALAADKPVADGPSEFFGRLDLSGAPAPQLITPHTVKGRHVHGHATTAAAHDDDEHADAPVAPVYFHVRPGEEERWATRCRLYAACDTPVLFVTEIWYRDVYLPHVSAQQDDREQRYRQLRDERDTRALTHRHSN